jgi:hypothetical protein
MQKDSKSLVADPVAGLAKLDLSAQPSPDGHDFTLQDDVPDNNLHPLVLTDKFKENLKHSKQTQNPANFQPKKSFCSWKHLRNFRYWWQFSQRSSLALITLSNFGKTWI